MKQLKFFGEIIQALQAVFIVIINKDAKIKAIQTWTNKLSFITFRDGKTLFSTKDLEAIRILRMNDRWELVAFLRASETGNRTYSIYENTDYSEVVRHRDLLLEELPNIKVLS